MSLLIDTFFLAALVAIISVFIALGFGLWRFGRWGRVIREVKWLILFFAAIPPFVQAGIWIDLLHLSGAPLQGLLPSVFLQVVTLLPLSLLIVIHGYEQIDCQGLEQGQLQTGGKRVLLSLVLPSLRPYAQSALGIVLVFSMMDYTIPTIFQYPVYGLDILESYAATGGGKEALFKGVYLMGLLLPVMLLSTLWLVKRSPLHNDQEQFRLFRLELPVFFLVYRVFSLILMLIILLAPLFVLFLTTGLPGQLLEVLQENSDIILYSLGIAAISALVVVILAFFVVQSGITKYSLTWIILLVIFCVPPALLGTGLQLLFNCDFLQFIYGTHAMLVIVNMLRFTAIAVLILFIIKKQMPQEWFENARLIQNRGFRLIRIDLPLMMPGLASVFLVTAILSLGEVGASIAVLPPGGETISIKLFNYLHYGAGDKVNALSLLIFLLIIGAYLLHLFIKRLSGKVRI